MNWCVEHRRHSERDHFCGCDESGVGASDIVLSGDATAGVSEQLADRAIAETKVCCNRRESSPEIVRPRILEFCGVEQIGDLFLKVCWMTRLAGAFKDKCCAIVIARSRQRIECVENGRPNSSDLAARISFRNNAQK